MTKSLRGSSLPQARSYHHNHYHLHNQRAATPENANHHHRQLDDPSPTTPSPDAATSSSAAAPRIVVQTVSLIQIVDATGSPIQVQTIFPTAATVDASSTTSAALDLSIAAVPSSTSSTDSSTTSSSTTNDSALSTPAPTTSTSTDSSTSQDISLTSDPLSTPAPSEATPSLYPTLSGQSNSTISFLTSTNSSSTSVSTATSLTSQLSSGSTSVTSSILSSLSSTTWGSNSGSTATSTSASTSVSGSSRLSTSTFTTSASQSPSNEATASGDGTAGGIGGGAAGTAAPTSTSTSDNSSGSGSPTPTATVVGSVVGSLAGAAFLVVLVFLALRWKKRTGGRFRLSEASAGKRGILTGSGGPPGGNGGGMVQRSLSFDPTTAAAGAGAGAGAMAVAHKPSSRRASEPSETGERGFVRVAGRKLPSVLQAGGDGYTDPREGTSAAVNDDESVYFRDSQAFFDPNGQTTRLALGSPMRPVSGVVVFKESPARTPVTESAPFPPPAASPQTNPPFVPLQPPGRDPIGRTLPSQDGSRGSRGSASRFHEDM
ncbi:hypothetical protein CPAR01_08572 [Colletotrichum paranaense]|uniref:Uncharacterized protein n=1 Tax=Colletotrichum paranaense TaxID=1914294 RepID=A0ABQ9SKM5_9PEZI|nr:uncharacterized protein CPAR01_08572 [Colletotrichum paranaense]KAK1538459.1 hypothetical protein CPAR01_08572 [Colletotrichum paranaense]